MLSNPAPIIERVDRFHVVRDDKIPGGTKRIILQSCLPELDSKHFVYVASSFGMGGPALALACAELGYRATLFVAQGKTPPPWLETAEKAGAEIIYVDPARVTDIEPLALENAHEQDADYLPLGFAFEAFHHHLVDYARRLEIAPAEIWCPVVSGTLAMALEKAFPQTAMHGVAVAKHHDYAGKGTVHEAPEKFVRQAAIPPPYPSWAFSDAKVWRFAKKLGADGALIWNSNA